jgi:hypothetical protein
LYGCGQTCLFGLKNQRETVSVKPAIAASLLSV